MVWLGRAIRRQRAELVELRERQRSEDAPGVGLRREIALELIDRSRLAAARTGRGSGGRGVPYT